MKRVAKVILVVMMILTGIYISTLVYANSPTSPGVAYNALLYKSETSPSIWYTPEQLGVVRITEFGPDESLQLQIVVDREKEPFPLQREQPIFQYKGRFFRVSDLWATMNPELARQGQSQQWQLFLGGALGAGWLFIGALFISWGKKK